MEGEKDKLKEVPEGGFAELVGEYLRYLSTARRLSPNSVRAYAGDLEAYLGWIEREEIDPLEVSHRQLRGYLADQTRGGYAAKTLNRRLSALRSLYRWLVHEGYTRKDCAAALSSPKLAKTLPHTVSDADVEALFESISGDGPEDLRDRALLELLYATGARIAEAAGLAVDDIDFAQAQVRLFGKGSKERIVPVYPIALEALRAYMVRARPELAARSKKEPTRSLFISSRGNAMSAAALRDRFELRCAQAGLDPEITPHAMRHTFATAVLDGGADLRSVQELLGHESLSTTQLYTHLSVDRLKAALRQAHPRGEEA